VDRKDRLLPRFAAITLVSPFGYPTLLKSMLFKTRSASVYGIEAHLVDVEVNITPTSGPNGEFFIVGLPDLAVRESRSRVIAAIRNSGFSSPYQKITVNLAPADLKKEGSAFDLPMAMALLGGQGFLNK